MSDRPCRLLLLIFPLLPQQPSRPLAIFRLVPLPLHSPSSTSSLLYTIFQVQWTEKTWNYTRHALISQGRQQLIIWRQNPKRSLNMSQIPNVVILILKRICLRRNDIQVFSVRLSSTSKNAILFHGRTIWFGLCVISACKTRVSVQGLWLADYLCESKCDWQVMWQGGM